MALGISSEFITMRKILIVLHVDISLPPHATNLGYYLRNERVHNIIMLPKFRQLLIVGNYNCNMNQHFVISTP